MLAALMDSVDDAEPRDEVFYAHVKKRNKLFMKQLAKQRETSVSAITDSLFDRLRQEHADSDRKSGKSKKRAAAASS